MFNGSQIDGTEHGCSNAVLTVVHPVVGEIGGSVSSAYQSRNTEYQMGDALLVNANIVTRQRSSFNSGQLSTDLGGELRSVATILLHQCHPSPTLILV